MSRKPELRGRAARLARLFPTGAGQAARTPFVLLVVLLLGGGLIGLLMLNSALSEGAFKLDDLERETKALTDEEQSLQRDIDAYSAPEALQRRARELGMVPGGDPAFLGPDGTVKGVPSPAPADPNAAYAPLVLAPEALVSEPTVPPAPSPTPATPATGAGVAEPQGAPSDPYAPSGATSPAPGYAPPQAAPAAPQYAPPAQQPIPSAQSSTYPTPGR
ncbi:septum formation initiator family protein [Streptomyces sp. ISL-22]|uniref:septum formation initiator family protein n=1 Tax=unclassified Streptomyces TaxID=2593676 RepID=UPI001BE86CB5|nr:MULTISPECIES: septum formation initiator family protein [unclassified Streptomyces]MBT2422891.1 septum formation initiator family protein [Streptomyces sp. ISL-24]MBT2432130.1 septum formation initiator family protein [Streptomyces sp. ISL-22]